jgi:hypothetical protein
MISHQENKEPEKTLGLFVLLVVNLLLNDVSVRHDRAVLR